MTITNDILVGGQVALTRGEEAMVEGVQPDDVRPEYKFVVLSPRLGTRFLLRDEDRYAAPPVQGLPPSQPQYPQEQYYGEQPAYQPEQEYRAPGEAFMQPPPPLSVQTAGKPKPQLASDTKVISLSIATGACGLLVIIATFLPWLTYPGVKGATGWSTMVQGMHGGFSLVLRAPGVMFFTGFWSLLLGSAIVTGGVLLLLGSAYGARVVQVAGLISVVLVLFSIITASTNGLTVGIGLWMFNFLALAASVLAQLTFRAY
jgi:hypothetical protein